MLELNKTYLFVSKQVTGTVYYRILAKDMSELSPKTQENVTKLQGHDAYFVSLLTAPPIFKNEFVGFIELSDDIGNKELFKIEIV